MEGTTIICGLERLSLRIARALIELGERVIVVADSPNPERLRQVTRAGAIFLKGRGAGLVHLADAELPSARCLVLTENTDLANLQTALAAREVNPELRVVMRMFNADLAERAARLLPNSRVLSSTAAAAPYFAADALGVATAPAHHVWGRHLVLHAAPAEPDSLAEANHVTELDSGQGLKQLEPPQLPRRRRLRRLRGYRRAIAAFFDLRLGVTLVAIGALIATSTVVSVGLCI